MIPIQQSCGLKVYVDSPLSDLVLEADTIRKFLPIFNQNPKPLRVDPQFCRFVLTWLKKEDPLPKEIASVNFITKELLKKQEAIRKKFVEIAKETTTHFREASAEFVCLNQTHLMRCIKRKKQESALFLIKQKKELHHRDATGRTALMLAIHEDLEEISHALIDAGVDLEVEDIFGFRALSYAIRGGHHSLVSHLLDKGAQLDPRSFYPGESPLFLAIKSARISIIKELLSRGFDPFEKDQNGFNYFQLAAISGIKPCLYALAEFHSDYKKEDFFDQFEGESQKKFAADTCLSICINRSDIEFFKKLIHQHLMLEGRLMESAFSFIYEAIQKAPIELIDFLLDCGLDPSAKMIWNDNHETSPFTHAICWNRLDLVKRFISTPNFFIENNSTGITPIQRAVQTRNLEMIQVLLDHGLDLNFNPIHIFHPGYTIDLHQLIQLKEWNLVEFLIKAQVESKSEKRWETVFNTPYPLFSIIKAINCFGNLSPEYKKLEHLFDFMINNGADGNKVSGETPLICFASFYDHTSLIKILIKTGKIAINAQDFDGKTALHYASKHKNIELIELLIEADADISILDNKRLPPLVDQESVLNYCIREDRIDLIEKLIERKTNLNTICPIKKISPLHLACALGHLKMVQLLIKKGQVDLDYACPKDGSTALSFSIREKHFPITRYLVESGVSLRKPDQSKETFLIESIVEASFETASFLAKRKELIVDERDYKERTALMLACQKNNLPLVELLCLRNADLDAVDHSGKSVLCYALDGSYAIFESLVSKGANIHLNLSGHLCLFKKAIELDDLDSAVLLIQKGYLIPFRDYDRFINTIYQSRVNRAQAAFLIGLLESRKLSMKK